MHFLVLTACSWGRKLCVRYFSCFSPRAFYPAQLTSDIGVAPACSSSAASSLLFVRIFSLGYFPFYRSGRRGDNWGAGRRTESDRGGADATDQPGSRRIAGA